MQLLFEKILTLGGWFYISLFISLLVSIKFRRSISTISLYISLIISIAYTIKQAQPFLPTLQALNQPLDMRLNRHTLGQHAYAQQLRAQHLSGQVCVLMDDDVTSTFLAQALYPATVSITTTKQDNTHCSHRINTQDAARQP